MRLPKRAEKLASRSREQHVRPKFGISLRLGFEHFCHHARQNGRLDFTGASTTTSKMRLEFEMIFLFDQSLSHRLAAPTKHRFRSPGTSPADLDGDLRLKRSSVRAAQPAAELYDEVLATMETQNVSHRDFHTAFFRSKASSGRRPQPFRQTAAFTRLPQLRLCSKKWVCW